MVPSIILISLCGGLFLFSLAYHSLREFSRSRLESICKQHENESRLGRILKRDEEATSAAALVQLLLIFAYCFLAARESPDLLGISLNLGILLFFSYLLPRGLARVLAEGFIFHFWPLLALIAWVFTPVLMAMDAADTLLHRMAGRIEPGGEGVPTLISEEIRTVIDEGEREGVIESSAGRIIQRLMELQHEDVTAVMTPRTDMVCLQIDTPLDQVRQQLIDAGHSRVPVYRESPDDLVGILYAKDLLQQLEKLEAGQIEFREILREPLYVPESHGIESLLERMRREHVHMAVVLDEYGGVVGLVTMEDILEEIVGDIEDEYDKEQAEEILQINPGLLEVDARVHIDDLNEQFELELPEDEDYETIGGFVFSHLGKIPLKDETFTWQTLRFTVLEADKRKVIKLRIEVDETLPVTV
ncbi:MAG: hemolysin family protein [Planctomycetaceae bacterium]|nr:HlyC/CorC family transporter [Planctomycetaceae bacterium]